VLSAQRNLPEPLAARLDQPWDDGISWLVAISGEPLAIHGEPLERFKISRLGKSVLVMPLKVRKEVVGLLTVLRKEAVPFGSNSQSLLSAVTDYASISIVNARLFQALEARARRLQQVAEAAQAVKQGNATYAAYTVAGSSGA
jgi:GAF domain-containing protein